MLIMSYKYLYINAINSRAANETAFHVLRLHKVNNF